MRASAEEVECWEDIIIIIDMFIIIIIIIIITTTTTIIVIIVILILLLLLLFRIRITTIRRRCRRSCGRCAARGRRSRGR